tara:strand:+ start:102 stop:566 length:465 start_codon:yes stop_codon:yes gene_type:complete
MASGREHDKSILFWSVPYGLVIATFLGLKIGAIASVAFLISGLWLSPDLDTNSLALKRWGPFRIIWWPYKKLFKHRSIFTHGLIIGSLLRIFYLLNLLIISIKILGLADILNFWETVNLIYLTITNYNFEFIIIFASIEASCFVHIAKDGDPMF